MAQSGGGFPFHERAAKVEAARTEVTRAFRAMVAARDSSRRADLSRPSVTAWKEAVARFHEAVSRAYPPDFWDHVAGLRQGEAAAVGPMLDFLAADPWFFRSGYVKAEVIRFLKRLPLSGREREKVRTIVLALVDGRDGREFRAYCRLARVADSEHLRAALAARVATTDPAVRRRAGWVLSALAQSDRRAPPPAASPGSGP